MEDAEERAVKSGIGEALENLSKNDLFYKYGVLVKEGRVVFDESLLDDADGLIKIISKFPSKKDFSW